MTDREKAGALARQVGVDFGAALTVALAYIGDRLGIFKALAQGMRLTTTQLSERTALNERYLREWASTMAAAGYIEYDPRNETFSMSREQVQVLVEDRNVVSMVGTFQYAVACYRQLPKLTEAFKHGGGVPFADFAPEIVEAIERMFQGGYETWVAQQWIPALPDIDERLRAGGDAADVGCGAGQCLIPVALAYPKSRFVGYDVDTTSITRAREKAAGAGASDHVTFQQVAAEALPADGRFDLVMAFNCIHDMANPRGALAGIRRALKPSGALMWSEADASDRLEDNLNPRGRSFYAASTMHCMTVSLAQGGEGLGVVVGERRARKMANEAGFSKFERLPIENPFHQIFVARP